jgi:TP901 family phage tail tape measure protein
MADNLITTNITANADFTGLRTQLAATTAQLLKLQEVTAGTNAKLANQIAVMNKAFATTLTSTGQFSQHFVSLTSDVEKFGRNLDRGQLKLNNYFQTWQGHTRKTSNLVRDLAKQQVMMEQAIIQPIGKNAQGLMQYNVMVAKGLDEVKNRTAIARQELAIMNKVMLDGSNQLINWGKNTQWAGRQLTVGLTVPLAAFGMAAQKAFREADQELVRLTKVYGGLSAVSATELAKVRKDVSDTAREIAGSYGIAYKDTIGLAADLAATGQQGEALLKATKETSRLAVLGEVDRQEAMKATLAIQNAFKSSTDELTQSIDFLNAVENQTSTSLADLVEAIPKAGPVVQSLGGDVKDLALYLTAMKEGGVNASEGANAIKSAMASLINPTKVAKEMFTGFGINIDQIVTSNAGNLTATIVELQGALDNLDPLSKSRAIEQLFGKFQYARMSALFENLGKEGSQTLQVMDLMKASATDLANISSRELGMMTESASGKFKRALASVQADLASVGNQFLTISTKVLEVVDGIIKFFQKLPQPVKTFLNVLGGITAVSGPIIMLAGVMGNFIGYVIKGIFHLRQLARGGQGFKLLTPEIMAADAAAKGLATSFYSDTEATVVLTNAINTLAASFDNLEIKAQSAKVAVQPGISTIAGSVISAGTPGGQRIVDKNNPLIGKSFSRDMSHFTPSGDDQMGTIFGTVPGAAPVNVRIGRNPQAYMNQDLPRIPGVTSVNGISTGIVAQEAAKWHAMTAAIAMQSEAELKLLKAEVTSTGTVTASLSDSYQALLPQFSQITELAAQETAAIVKQLQASKITVDQARAKVLQLNATVEAMLAETAALTASTMGRTVNLTTVPLTSQPVVDPTTGKSNMKEMFHKGPTKTLVDKIARALGGVRTSGAGYNIETTKPKFNKGGIVPGTGNTDTYHTTAEEGSFVINKAGTEANMPIIQNLLGGRPAYRNRGGQVPVVLTPGEAVIPADIAQKDMPLMYSLNGGPGNTGFGLSEGGNPDWGTWKKILRLQERYQNAFDPEKGNVGGWQKELAHRSVMHDATVLNNKGIPIDQAVEIASENYRKAMLPKPEGAMGENGTIDKKVWRDIRQAQFNDAVKLVRNANSNVDPKNRRQLNTDAVGRIGASDARPTPAMLDYITSNPDKFGGKDFVDRLFKDLGFERKSGKWVIDKYGKVSATNLHSTHTSPDAKWGYKAAGNFGQAFWGEADLNTAANDVRRALMIKGQKGSTFSYFPDEVLMTDRAIALQDRSWLKRFGTTVPQAILDRRKGIISLPQLFRLMRRGVASKSLGFGQIAQTANKGGEIEGRFAQGGEIPGKFAQRLFGGGKAMFLGMPKTIKQVEAQRAARAAMEKADQAVKNSRYSKDQVTTYDEKLQSDDKGHSFPVGGIGGIYSRNGEKFFVKPVVSEKRALGESRFNEITNDLKNGLKAPEQKVVVIKDPTDPAGRRKLLALESKYDPDFANMPDTFDEDTYFKQLALSALRGDKDLARGNLGGNRVADGGTSGVFNTASGDADYSATMPSFKHQAFVNLLGVKGSNTKKFFAEATSDIPKGMTADQYHQRMLDEIENVLPRLKQTISRFDLNPEETVVYNAMIQRLSDARRENYRDLHSLHSSIEITPKKQMTPAAIAKMIAADELKRRQKGHAASLSDNDFKNDSNGFNIGGMIGNVLKGRAMHRIGAGFGPTGAPKPSMYESAPWGVNSLSIKMAETLFASTGLRKNTQKLFYDKFAAALAKEKPYGYVKDAQGSLKNALEPDVLDSVIRSAASDLIGDRAVLSQLSPIDKDILRKKFLNWESKKDTPLTESLKQVIFGLEKREMGGPVNSGQPYIVGEKGPELFVPRNAGGIIPNKSTMSQGYNMGGMIKMMLMQMLGAYGGQAAGKASGIPGGDMIGMMLGSMLGMGGSGFGGGAKAPMTSKGKLTAPIGATKALDGVTVNGKDLMVLTKYGERLEKASLEGGKFAKMGVFAAKAFTRLNLIVAAGSLAIGISINRYKAHQESMRLNALGYGMTAEQAEKAGLKFTNFNDKIKEAIANAKALKERNTLLYESMQGSGTPINVTIEEYKKLKKEVKDNYSDQVLLINKTSADDQEALAIRLKEQLIAMGVSAEEASKKIYAMYASSEFASIASKVTVGSKGKFNEIKDTATAAASALESLNAAMATDRDPTEQANQLNTALMALSTDVEKRQADAVKKQRALATKEGRYFSSGDEKQAKLKAEEEAIEAINKDVQSQAVLTREVVDEMAKIDPAIRQIVNEQDTALSLWQKTRIQVKGYTGDLRNLTAAQTNDLYQLQIALGKVIESANRAKGGALEKQYAKLDKDKQRQAAYERAAKGQKVADQISDREKMSALQKQIDLNNKLADARIKALTAAKEEGDIAREIAKKQAEYDAALATGNTAGAQQASLDMEGLIGQQQFNSQVKNEENARDVKNAPLLKQIEAMQKKQQKLSDNAALAGEKLGDLTKSIATQESAIDAVNSSMLDYQIKLSNMEPAERKKWEASRAAREQLAAIGDAAAKAGIKLDGLKGIDLGQQLMKNLESGLGSVKTIVTNGAVTIVVDGKKFDIGKGGDGSYSNPFQGGSASVALGKSKAGLPVRETITEGGWDTSFGPTGDREIVKKYAKQQDFAKDTQFTLTNKDGSVAQFKVVDDKFNVQLQKITPAEKKAMGGYIPGYSEGSGGTVSGPGTSTSDSIPAYLSNGEYVVKASAVEQYGVPFFDKLNAQKFAGGGSAKNKSLMQPGDKWDNRSTTQAIGKFLLGNVGPQSGLLNAFPKDIKNKITSAMWSMFGKPFEEIAAGSPTKGDWANAALSMVPVGGAAGASKAALGLKNIKEAKAWTHYAHQAATEVFPSIGRQSNAMANYGLGTYGSASDMFKGAQFGEEAHKLSLSPLALIKTALGKGPITDAGLAKEAAAFNKATGRKISGSAMYLNDEEFVSFLSKRGYSGYKVDDVITNWKIGSGGVGLKNSLGKLPFGKQPGPISYPELPELQGLVLAQGGYIPKFETGINNVPADMLAQLHKNEAVIPANMNPFNPNSNNATMGATYNITNNINGYDGDLNQLSRMVTQQTVTAIKSMDSRAASALGPQMNVGIR